jgi:sugar phosphate isomerase/epimerase
MDCLEECCKVAAGKAVTVFLEPLNRYESDYVNTVDDVLKIIRQLGLSNVKVLADTFHMNIEEVNLSDSLKRAGPSLGFVHLADSNRQAPGHGHLDIRGVLGALKELGYQGYLSFEILPLPTPRQGAEDAIRCVKGILSDL